METLPDGWKLYHSFYKTWSGANSSATPPIKTKTYVPLLKPAVYGWRRLKVQTVRPLVPLVTREGKKKTGAALRRANFLNSIPRKPVYRYVPRFVQIKPAVVVQKRSFPVTPKRTRVYQENPYSCYIKEVREDDFMAQRNGSGSYPGVIGEQHANSLASTLWEAADDYALIEKLQTRLVGSTFHLGNALGESRKTLSFIGDSAVRVARSLAELKHGRILSAIKSLEGRTPTKKQLNASVRDPASAWLEYTYAVKPLLKDVQEAAEFLGFTLAAPRTHLETVTRNAKGKYFHLAQNHVWGFTPTSKIYVPVEVSVSKRLKAKLYEVDISSMSGLTDIASVAWEITPYSFVADWFLPIGRFLNARNVLGSISGLYTVTTRIKQVTWTPYIVNTNPNDVFVFTKKPESYFTKTLSINRTVNTAFVPQRPSFRPLEKSFSFSHCLSSIALLVSRFGSR